MKKKAMLIAALLFVFSAVGAVYRYSLHRQIVRNVESAAAAHRAALADSAEITRGIKAYSDTIDARQTLSNDELQLQNDQLRYDIADLKSKQRNRLQIQKDMAIVNNDNLAIRLRDPSVPQLDPYQAEARIKAHNRAYPFDKLADIGDLNKEIEDFHSKIDAILKNENTELRKH
jgi:hypothetical protein